jgi:hypothetical protein
MAAAIPTSPRRPVGFRRDGRRNSEDRVSRRASARRVSCGQPETLIVPVVAGVPVVADGGAAVARLVVPGAAADDAVGTIGLRKVERIMVMIRWLYPPPSTRRRLSGVATNDRTPDR